MKSKIEEVMSSLELLDARAKRASDLSGGMKRKLSVAMAIVGDNKVCVMWIAVKACRTCINL